MKLKENDNVPEIRFDYFKEEWDKKRFKDFTKLSQGLQIAISSRFLEDGKHRYFYITNEFLNPNSTKKYYIESPSENVICTVDDILMTRTGNTGKVITNISGAFHNNFFKVDYDKFETSKMFLYYLLTSNDIQKEIIIRAGNSTIPDLNHSDFYSIKTSVPSLDEQSAIGSLFSTLDDLLDSYKDNLVNYQSFKVTMLSKMFPKAGQTVPEIRLEGFVGDWEVVNLGTLIESYDEIISGASGFPIATSSRKGLYLQNDYFEGGRTGIDLTLDFHRVPMGYVTYRHMSDDSIFKFNKNNFETDVLVSKEYPVFISNDRSDIDFLLYHLNNSGLFLRFSTMQKLGGTRVRLYYKNLITYRLSVPKVKEQQAIGAYFSNLDNLISAHKEKISQLETLKKKLLQDMFI